MDKTLHSKLLMRSQRNPIPLARGMGWGLLGGLAGTLMMDTLLMGALSTFGLPALTCFSIVGDTVARFLAMLDMQVAGGIPAGVVTHYLVGPLFGIIFGTVVTIFPALRNGTLKKIMIAAILYVEILSQPILVTTPILLKMTTPETLQWFGGSFVMHFILAVVLGIIVGYGLHSAPIATQRRSQ
ncbi:MAG: hypothetical protein HY865_03525 [Chloroflexi bacterium]|nr:hypothetical protein [Chloroflexota bacterium]